MTAPAGQLTEQQMAEMLATIYGATPHPVPWALWTLPAAERAAVKRKLAEFVADYNATYAVTENELIWPCWEQHEAVVRELAALYAQWVIAHEGGIAASPEKSLYWHDRWLPGFQKRVVERWFGVRKNTCSAGSHKRNWRPAEEGMPTGLPKPTTLLPPPGE